MEINNLDEILKLAIQKNASDIHLVVDKSPLFRIHGEITVSELPVLDRPRLEKLVRDKLTKHHTEFLLENKELDFSYTALGNTQFRFNVYFERGCIAATIRIMPSEIQSMEQLRLPPVIKRLASRRKGLIVISGTAGSGKSTTMNYIINLINHAKSGKIITIEDPIEYLHPSRKCLIVQREVGQDTNSFRNALKYALRQDPDVVVVGEMRDFESMSMAMTTAETGHLVLTTVHAPDAVETLNRIIDVYPAGYRDQICTQLAGNLLGIICQALIPRKDGQGRVLATEVLTATMSIRNLIRRGAFTEIRAQLDNEIEDEVHTFELCLSDLVKKDLISEEKAIEFSKSPELLTFEDSPRFAKFNTGEPESPEVVENMQIDRGSKKVLIVDSEQKDIEEIRGILRDMGYSKISISKDGKEALDLGKKLKPDLIIVDTNAIQVDGFELCRHWRADPAMKSYLILLTGRFQMSYPDKAKEVGADDLTIKTTNNNLLIRAIKKFEDSNGN